MVNGNHLKNATSLGKILQQPVKFDFNEMTFRRIAMQVKSDAEKLGGAFPMPDPAGFLAAVIITDKLNEILERISKIEAILSVPEDAADSMLDPGDGIHGSDGT